MTNPVTAPATDAERLFHDCYSYVEMASHGTGVTHYALMTSGTVFSLWQRGRLNALVDRLEGTLFGMVSQHGVVLTLNGHLNRADVRALTVTLTAVLSNGNAITVEPATDMVLVPMLLAPRLRVAGVQTHCGDEFQVDGRIVLERLGELPTAVVGHNFQSDVRLEWRGVNPLSCRLMLEHALLRAIDALVELDAEQGFGPRLLPAVVSHW